MVSKIDIVREILEGAIKPPLVLKEIKNGFGAYDGEKEIVYFVEEDNGMVSNIMCNVPSWNDLVPKFADPGFVDKFRELVERALYG